MPLVHHLGALLTVAARAYCERYAPMVNGKYGSWIRPVSARYSKEVSYSEYRYQSGESPKLLDIIDVPLFKTAPHNHQTENHVIDATACWIKKASWYRMGWNHCGSDQLPSGSIAITQRAGPTTA